MKSPSMSIAAIALVFMLGSGAALHAQTPDSSSSISVKSLPASVLKTTPQAGDTTVDPGMKEISVTFSKEMQTSGWSICKISDATFPQKTGEPHFLPDKRTCVMSVRLEPGKTYALWFNSTKFSDFRDSANTSSVPYLLVFETKKQN